MTSNVDPLTERVKRYGNFRTKFPVVVRSDSDVILSVITIENLETDNEAFYWEKWVP